MQTINLLSISCRDIPPRSSRDAVPWLIPRNGIPGFNLFPTALEVVTIADAAARRCHPAADVRRSIHEYRPLVARGKAQSCPELEPRRPCLIPLHFAAEAGIGQESYVAFAARVTQVLRATCTRSSPSDSRPNTFPPMIPIRRPPTDTVADVPSRPLTRRPALPAPVSL